MPEWLPSSVDEIEVQKVFILQVTITDTEIVMAEREMAIYNITTDIEVIVMTEEEDYTSAIYDEEDGVFRGVKQYENVYKTSLPVTLQCQFACTEGLEVNFLLTHVEYPDVQELPLDKDELLDLKEWAKGLKVIIQGVENNQITETGEGSQEFDNFSDDQSAFPTLKSLRDSKDFLLNRDIITSDLVHGPILYYSSALIDRLYS